MLDRLWAQVWLAVFLATIVPLIAFTVLGVLLLQSNLRSADIASLSRHARLLSAIVERQPLAQRSTLQDAVASIGRELTVVSAAAAAAYLPPDAAEELAARGHVAGAMQEPRPALYAAVRRGSDVIILMRPYSSPEVPWRSWSRRLVLGSIIAVGCAIVASVALARQVTRPVATVADASRRLAQGGTPPPVTRSGPRELRELEESFNEMSRQLAAAHEEQRTFLLSVSHELKTPVAAVRGFALGQQEGVVEPAMASEFILAESTRLERLVEDLLDLARVGQGRFEIREEVIDLAILAEEAVRRCAAAARQLETDVELVALPGATARSDPDRVVQVISNLVENALRLSPGGSVRVVVAPGTVTVTDSGPGLDTDDLAHAFDRFRLYDRYKTLRPVGTGLGLALVRELVEAMHGEVRVQSAPGEGTVFSVRLPAAGDGGGAI